MHRVICSTGALIGRPNGRDYRLIASCVDHLQCDAYEFMLYESWYDQLEELAGFLAALSLDVPVFHCEKHIGEAIGRMASGDLELALKRFEINCQLAAFLHASRMVMHLWNGPVSDSCFENNLAAYPRLKAIAAAHGIDLMIENVVCGHADPLAHWYALAQIDPCVQFTFDTKMAAFHGQMETMYAPENRWLWDQGHIAHLHVNDYGGGYRDWENLKTLHIGQGKIDFDKLFVFLSKAGYAGDYTVEATSFMPDGIIDWGALNKTFAYIRAHGT